MQVRFHKHFEIQLAKQHKPIQNQFFKRLDLFLSHDRHPLLQRHRLSGEWKTCESINVTGDVRAIFLFDSTTDTATFLQIGTHHQLYG